MRGAEFIRAGTLVERSRDIRKMIVVEREISFLVFQNKFEQRLVILHHFAIKFDIIMIWIFG